ncbi:MAG TPA: radical SAM family heme chaperone HemW [Pyrinomonadaceae bacterium]|nr:radical SAM family heme chaperone HemW [Pyrinomonadaceae bacterium]
MSAGLYLHIPFCRSRCSYCDFATDVYKDGDTVERYVRAICREIEAFGPAGVGADTIYFGGGTPSLLTPKQVERILGSVQEKFAIDAGAEITMEMNPATVSAESVAAYRSLGVNRASFGVQTFNDTELKRLARGHDANDARNTFRLLRENGFDNVSFDLIAGLPRQTLSDWEANIDEAIGMRPEHLSLYLLEIHEGTPLAEQVRTGRQPKPDEELAAQMYEVLLDRLRNAGYVQYEISNFSLPGFWSRHNSKYWQMQPVYAFGVSAHSFDGAERYTNDRDTASYVKKVEQETTAEVFRETTDLASETAFLALRTTDGLDLAKYFERFGVDVTTKFEDEICRVRDAGLVEIGGGRLRLTPKGMLYSNEVFRIFV